MEGWSYAHPHTPIIPPISHLSSPSRHGALGRIGRTHLVEFAFCNLQLGLKFAVPSSQFPVRSLKFSVLGFEFARWNGFEGKAQPVGYISIHAVLVPLQLQTSGGVFFQAVLSDRLVAASFRLFLTEIWGCFRCSLGRVVYAEAGKGAALASGGFVLKPIR
jgi:hypothetical protein